jgi:hypothetical protein
MNYIIDFKDELTVEQIDQYLVDNDITKIKEYSFFDRVYLVSSDNPLSPDDYVEAVTQDDDNDIQLLGIEVAIAPQPGTTTAFDVQDNKNWWKTVVLSGVDFDEETHVFPRYGKNSVVYMMDSGIDANHSEFVNANIELLHSITDNFNDTNGHGTALTSLVVGDTCGLTSATVKVVKIFEAGHALLQSELLTALEQVGIDYVNNGMLPSVVNCSWSIPFNSYINSKIQYLLDKGLFVVASAGNSGMPIVDVTPACIPDVFTIGSFGQELTPSNFSNYTDPSFISFTANETNYGQLDSWAPGEQIWAAVPNGNLGYIAGTSAAAAIASGALAYNASKYIESDGTNNIEFTSFIKYKESLEDTAELGGNTDKMPYEISNMVYFSLGSGKIGLLDLSDQKFASSINQIVGYVHSVSKPQSAFKLVALRSGSSTVRHLFSQLDLASVSIQADITGFLDIHQNGVVYINVPEIEDSYSIIDIPIEYHYSDGSSFEQTLRFIVLKDTTVYQLRTEEIEDDPVLNLTFNASCAYTGFCLSDDCGIVFNFPGSLLGCYGSAPYNNKFYFCACLPASDVRLKENIHLVDEVDGIKLYSFNYKNNNSKTHIGVMAQELLETRYKDTVFSVNGYYRVNYCKLPDSIRKRCVFN